MSTLDKALKVLGVVDKALPAIGRVFAWLDDARKSLPRYELRKARRERRRGDG